MTKVNGIHYLFEYILNCLFTFANAPVLQILAFNIFGNYIDVFRRCDNFNNFCKIVMLKKSKDLQLLRKLFKIIRSETFFIQGANNNLLIGNEICGIANYTKTRYCNFLLYCIVFDLHYLDFATA